MPKNLKFTIVTPSFNQVNTLKQTIDSVLNQDYPHLEYFVYDNCSTDGSIKIIKQYKQIKAQIKRDLGQPDALNKAFSHAKGDIYAFINSDDYYLPGTLNQVAQYFSDHPDCQWLVGNCSTFPKSFSWTFWFKELVPYDKFPVLLLIFNFVNQPSVFIKRELFHKVGKFDISLLYCFDYDYWLRILKLAKPHRLFVPLSVFRITGTSKGSTSFEKQFSEDNLVVQKYTQNSIILAIHWLIGKIIVFLYESLKKTTP